MPKARPTLTPKPRPTKTPKPKLTKTPKPRPPKVAKPTKTAKPIPTATPEPIDGPHMRLAPGVLKLEWREQSGVDGWNVYFSPKKKGKYRKVNKKLVKEPSFTIYDPRLKLVAGRYYYVKLSTVRKGKESRKSQAMRVQAVPKR